MKNKGFTLIELLAVIVILAIIALIAIPMVSKIIDKTEDSAVLRSAELYIDGVNQSIMRANLANKIRPKECEIQENGDLICDGEYEIKIEATGTKPSSGTLIIEDRAVKSFTGMILDIYELETDENGKIIVKNIIEDENGEEYVDSTGAVVEVPKGLVPVVYSLNKWRITSTKKAWYNYANQEWANAVILKSGVSKRSGDTIDVTKDIEGMFVYVPRYEYKIDGTYGKGGSSAILPGEIEVNFISKDTTAPSNGYRIHPAFTFGTKELSGIWVGKFETSGTADAPKVLPNEVSLVNQIVGEQFKTAQKFNECIKNSNIDAHMAKNSEWGAAAYLSQSKYGKYGNPNYTGANKQVIHNNCSNRITGVGADSYLIASSETTCTTNTYETLKGQAASTTGNITGIYDMSGGSEEWVMGVYRGTGASSTWGASTYGNEAGFTSAPDAKYYDNYTSTNAATACNGGICYGHALSETIGWYGNEKSFINADYPWIYRGGYYYSSSVGVFQFDFGGGYDLSVGSFRIVLAGL